MKKTIKGKKLKKTEFPIKGILNEFYDSRQIIFHEKDTGDVVQLNVIVGDGQYAEYSEEYLPATLEKQNHKRADITLAIIDEEQKRMKYIIADAKSNICGEDMIFNLCEQWQAGLKYTRDTILCNLESDIQEEEQVIVFTRNFDEEKIGRMIQGRERKLEELRVNQSKGLSVVKAIMMQGVKLQKEYELLKLFIQKKFSYSDRYAQDEIHEFDICSLIHNDSTNNYECFLNVCL